MKKHFFLFSFMVCFSVLASAQTAKQNTRLKLIPVNSELAILNQSKAEETKKALLNKSAENVVKGADQLAAEAAELKMKNKR